MSGRKESLCQSVGGPEAESILVVVFRSEETERRQIDHLIGYIRIVLDNHSRGVYKHLVWSDSNGLCCTCSHCHHRIKCPTSCHFDHSAVGVLPQRILHSGVCCFCQGFVVQKR